MKGSQAQPADSGNLRSKYQALLDELSLRETRSLKKHGHYAAIQEMLFAWVQDEADGARGALDRLLATLAQPDIPDSFPVQLEALQQKLRKLQDHRAQRASALLAAMYELTALLKQHSNSPDSRKALGRLQRKLKSNPEAGSAALERTVLDCANQLAQEQKAFIASLDSSHRQSGGLLAKLFGSIKSRMASPARQGVQADTAPAQRADAQAGQATGDSATEPAIVGADTELPAEGGTLSDEVAAILLGLLARLDVPADKRPVLQKLYTELQNGLSLEELVEVLDHTVEVVVAALGRDQAEFESFLDALDSKLGFFDSFVRDLNQQLGAFASGGEALESSVARQLDAVRTAFREAGAEFENDPADGRLAELAQRVYGNLDAVAGMLTEFGAGQMHHIAALEEKLGELQAEVEVLRVESAQARQRIHDQRDKLLRDTLTGIANREAYEIRLEDEYKRWRRYQRPLTLVMADIDLFKQVNDNYGHAAGDKVLKIVAKVMARQLRESDFVARFGGEEFVFLLPETSADAAAMAVEKVRKAIESSPFNFKQRRVPITCSFGIAEFAGEDLPAQVFERADQALYRAKRAGRNRWEGAGT